jgi:hypothetical protein
MANSTLTGCIEGFIIFKQVRKGLSTSLNFLNLSLTVNYFSLISFSFWPVNHLIQNSKVFCNTKGFYIFPKWFTLFRIWQNWFDSIWLNKTEVMNFTSSVCI